MNYKMKLGSKENHDPNNFSQKDQNIINKAPQSAFNYKASDTIKPTPKKGYYDTMTPQDSASIKRVKQRTNFNARNFGFDFAINQEKIELKPFEDKFGDINVSRIKPDKK